MLICRPHIFFGEVSVHIFCPFCNWVVFLSLHFESSLYILDTSSLLDMCFVNIFNVSLWLVFSPSSLSEISFHICVDLFPDSLFCSIDLFVGSLHQYHSFGYHSFIINLEIR